MNKEDLIKKLKDRFGAINEDEEISKEDLAFLNERDEIKELYSWDFEAFVKNYKLIKEYAVEEELLKNFAWIIENQMEKSELEEFKRTKFYQKFNQHSTIIDAITKLRLNDRKER